MLYMRRALKDLKSIPINWGTAKDLAIIIDTNVLSYMLIPEAKKQIEELLEDYKKGSDKFELKVINTISAVSIFECLQSDKQSEYLDLFKNFKCYELDLDTQLVAAHLKTFYLKHGITIKDLPDLYISSTALLNANAILTANHSDYPNILFKEVGAKQINWKEKNRTKGLVLYLLRPDYVKARNTKFISVIEY